MFLVDSQYTATLSDIQIKSHIRQQYRIIAGKTECVSRVDNSCRGRNVLEFDKKEMDILAAKGDQKRGRGQPGEIS